MRKIVAMLVVVFVVAGTGMLCGCVVESEPKTGIIENIYPDTMIVECSIHSATEIYYMGIDGDALLFTVMRESGWSDKTYSYPKFTYSPGMTRRIDQYKLGHIIVEDFDKQTISFYLEKV